MKIGWKIFIIALVLVIILAVIFIVFTIFQGKQLVEATSPEIQASIKSDIESVMKGDCSKLPELEKNLESIQAKLKSACANPALKPIIQKQAPEGVDVCAQINNPDSDAYKQLEYMRKNCPPK